MRGPVPRGCRHTERQYPARATGTFMRHGHVGPSQKPQFREMPSAFHASAKGSCDPTLHAAHQKGEYYKSTNYTRDCQEIFQQSQTAAATSSTSPMMENDSDATVHFPHER